VTQQAPTRRVGILLFPDVEALDFAGPFEVFTTASRVATRGGAPAPPFEVCSVAATSAPVRARAGLTIVPDFTFDAHPPVDVLVVPGGVVDAERARPQTLRWLSQVSASASLTASVCTGAFLLADAGILRDQAVTTHWEDQAELALAFPALRVISGVRWVDEGGPVTSAGISAGIDMSLHLVERLAGRELAVRTARQMEFDWAPGSGRGPGGAPWC